MNDYTKPQAPKQIDPVTHHIKGILNHYKEPLVEAIRILQKEGYSLEKISETVFKGRISKQAISQNYLGDKK